LTLSVSSKLGKLMVLRTIPRKIPRVLRSIEVKIVFLAKFLINKIRIPSISGRLTVLRSIPHKSFWILRTAQVKIIPVTKSLVNPISQIRVSKLRIWSVVRVITPKIPQLSKRSQVRIVSQTKTSIKSLSKISFSELNYPVKEISNIPNEIVILLDEFSYLPMWFTMPIIFAASFALGAIVSLLI